MRFAKLEVTLILAYFFAQFDFELAADAKGTPSTKPIPLPSNDVLFATRPSDPVHLRYKPRSGAF